MLQRKIFLEGPVRNILLFFLPILLFAKPHFDPPDVYVDGIVNAITGRCSILEEDLIVRGAEPISLRRQYTCYNRQERDGGWEFIPGVHPI